MKTSTKINVAALAVIVVVAALVFGWVAIRTVAAPTPQASGDGSTSTSTPVVAENSYRLEPVGASTVTFTEFLDFECEACGAVYPVVEQLREEYAGRVTFVARYFPLPGHVNSMNAALAVEAAAQQGKFEEMYDKMFVTQPEWGDQQVSKVDLFRQFAEELQLDLAEYDAAVADPVNEARIRFDFDAGVALGVEGTPTIFIGEQVIELTSVGAIRDSLDAALAEDGS